MGYYMHCGLHFIFKLYDGKNFFDVDNLKERVQNKANNSFKYDGKDWLLVTGIYYIDDEQKFI